MTNVNELVRRQVLKMAGDDIGERIKKYFAAFDRVGFARWIEAGLRDTYSPSRDSERHLPFDPVYPEMVYKDAARADGGVYDFLGRVYDKFFFDSNKRMFRMAIGDVLGSQIGELLRVSPCGLNP